MPPTRWKQRRAIMEIADGRVRVVGTDRAISFAEVAARASKDHDTLSAADTFTPGEPTYPNGTHIAEVEVDPGTGAVVDSQLRRRR